jgi:hypothetical protein
MSSNLLYYGNVLAERPEVVSFSILGKADYMSITMPVIRLDTNVHIFLDTRSAEIFWLSHFGEIGGTGVPPLREDDDIACESSSL